MARKIIFENGYTFNPSTKTIVIPRFIARERLVLITNVSSNKVIFNFSDPALNATSFTNTSVAGADTTTIVLNYNTSAMLATDKLQITIDEFVEKFEPADVLMDATNKLRTSSPQALVDTDFEYGMQVSKWENLATTNNRPFAYAFPTAIPNISAISIPQNSRTVTVTTTLNHGLTAGTAIAVQDSFFYPANGNFIIETVPSATTFTYTARGVNPSSTITGIFDTNKTAIYLGTLYTGAAIGAAPSFSVSGNAVTVTTTVPHGLSLGNEIAVTGITGTNPPNGSFIVTGVTSPTVFTFYANAAPSGLTTTSAAVYARPQAQFLHRAFDGGVLFTSNGASNNEAAIRQTRRYFRYQSGKGIQMSSGTALKPNLHLDALTSSGNTVTVVTKEQHNVQIGATVTVFGANEAAYNGTFTVTNVTGFNSFQYTALTVPSATVASGNYFASITGWYGATNRLGMFDAQNGLFWEFDGTTLNAVRRSSTFQVAGRVTVTNGSNTVTQTDPSVPTYFNKQIAVGDSIVLRGQAYRVQDIASDTSLTITPSYRGATAQFTVLSKTIDTKIPQSQFNLDKLDGTGPSGYNIDLSKMQMFYVDYTWYGAGYVRWGVRGPQGNIIYAHRMQNNNVNTEAYMRSGNLPGRYETNTNSKITQITSSVGSSDVTLNVVSTVGFAPATPTAPGTLVIRSGSAFEYVNYTGTTATSFTGLTRAQAGLSTNFTVAAGSNVGTVASATGIQVGQRVIHSSIPDNTFVAGINGLTITLSNAVTVANPTGVVFAPMATTAQTFTYSATAPVAVEQAFPTYAPSISHWGTSVIMDGRYDDDKSLLFTYGQTAFTSVPTAVTVTPTLTGTAGQYTVTVSSATSITVGMTVTAVGVGTGAVVTGVSGTTVTLSVPNTAAMSGTASTFTGGNVRALFSIRIAPSVDNGTPAAFGARELTNRMQLILRAMDVTTSTSGANYLVTATINGLPNTATAWTNAVKNTPNVVNSSLAQLADYSATGQSIVTGGETTGGFLVSGTSSVDLNLVRDLGNSILGGGGTVANGSTYPDGPDVLTLSVTNLGASAISVLGRLSWSEAQA